MRLVFLFARFYPYIMIPVAYLAFEMGMFYRRRAEGKKQKLSWVLAFGILATVTCWFVFRGDLNSDQWVRALTGELP